MPKPKVFLDSSVIISALLSARGGSFYILDFYKGSYAFQLNQYALDEIRHILGSKFVRLPELETKLFFLLGASQVTILPNPSKKQVKETLKYISANDAPILASVLKNSDYIITLDKEFFKPEIIELSAIRSFKSLTPKEFIVMHRNQNRL